MMSVNPAMYRGKPLNEMGKEELIEVVIELGTELDAMYGQHIKDADWLAIRELLEPYKPVPRVHVGEIK